MSLKNSYHVAKEKFSEFCQNRELKDFGSIIQIIHQDGSIFVLHHASIWYSEEQDSFGPPHGNSVGPKFIGVSTEHNGDHLFYAGDLVDWWVK
jgi:hypothetical protein